MQNWIVYIKEHVNSDLWGFILLDYYYHKKSEDYKGTPSEFIDEMLRELPREGIDIVAFHRSLLSVCVHLLGIDFSDIMEKSIAFLKSLTIPISDDQVRSIVAQYEIYGKQEVFRETLATSQVSIIEKQTTTKKVNSKENVEKIEIIELPLLSYLSRIETGKPLEKYVMVFVQHLLGDFTRLIPSLEKLGISPENTIILGIPYSTKSNVVSYLRDKKEYTVLTPNNYPFTEYVDKLIAESVKRAKTKDRKILIVEDGGYVVPRLHEQYSDNIDLFKGAVEQTANGIWRDRELEQKRMLKIPVMNVAECPLKQLIESPLVGEAIVRNLVNLLTKIGKSIRGKEVLVVGYGNIGKQVADNLKRNNVITYVYDFDNTKLLQARNDGHSVKDNLAEAVKNKFAIIGGTGREVIDRDVILLLDHNTHLINATSKRAEINFDQLTALTVTNGIREIGGGAAQVHKLVNEKDVILVAKGFPVNFYGEAESIPDEDIQFVFGLLFKGVLEVAKNELKPGIHDIPEEIRQDIATLQLKLRA